MLPPILQLKFLYFSVQLSFFHHLTKILVVQAVAGCVAKLFSNCHVAKRLAITFDFFLKIMQDFFFKLRQNAAIFGS